MSRMPRKTRSLKGTIAAVPIAIVLLMVGRFMVSDVPEEQTTPVVENTAGEVSEETKEEVVVESTDFREQLVYLKDAPYEEVNKNIPYFTKGDLTTEAFETYSELDSLGRCGVAYANICKEIMPTEERKAIGSVKPSGWHTVKYPEQIKDRYLYNRCHLIGYQLAGENANVRNLITGTRYLNVEGMLPFEDEVADYVKNTGNHVLYRVTPVFDGDNLVADGVLMEAYSVEDKGRGVCYCVFVYNKQPGIEIDYATGDSRVAGN